MNPGRPNVFEIDLGAVAKCAAQIRSVLGDDIRFIATMKANGYGYGVLPVAQTVLAAGAEALSLASLTDAVTLREAGVMVPILLYAGSLPDAEMVAACERYEFMPTLHDAYSLDAFARHVTRPMAVAVKVDVGPERIGVPIDEALDFIARVNQHPLLTVELVNAHPNVRGGADAQACLDWQYQQMVDLQAGLEQAGIVVPWRVMASSKVLRMAGDKMLLNAADPGAALFAPLFPERLQEGEGQPFRALKSRLIAIREVRRTEFMDEAPFPMHAGMRIGVLPIGYSDGVHRLHAGVMLVGGQRVPVLGSPALEYTRVCLDTLPDAQVGDEVVIIGSQGDARIAPEEVARFQGAARVVDLALQVGPAIPRHYLPAVTPGGG